MLKRQANDAPLVAGLWYVPVMDLLLKQVMFDPGVPLGSLNKTLKTVDDFSASTDWCGVGIF